MATKKVESLVSRLQSNRGVQARKDAIRDFTEWFLSEKPEFDPYTIRLLLAGDISNGYSIGIIQFCGKQKKGGQSTESYQYKESVKLALELWVTCIHESFGMHAKIFQNQLKNIKIGVYYEARLDIHIQIKEMKEYAGILIDAIMYSTNFKLNEILPNKSAQNAFKIWIKKKKGIDFNDEDGVDLNESNINKTISNNKKIKNKPTKWEEVKAEDLIIDTDDNNDEWFDTLDFVGRKRQNDDVDVVADDDDNNEDDEYYFDDPLGQKKRFDKKKDFFDLRIDADRIDEDTMTKRKYSKKKNTNNDIKEDEVMAYIEDEKDD